MGWQLKFINTDYKFYWILYLFLLSSIYTFIYQVDNKYLNFLSKISNIFSSIIFGQNCFILNNGFPLSSNNI